MFHYVLPAHDDRFVVKFLKGHRAIKRKTEKKNRTSSGYYFVKDVKWRSFENWYSYSYFWAIEWYSETCNVHLGMYPLCIMDVVVATKPTVIVLTINSLVYQLSDNFGLTSVNCAVYPNWNSPVIIYKLTFNNNLIFRHSRSKSII